MKIGDTPRSYIAEVEEVIYRRNGIHISPRLDNSAVNLTVLTEGAIGMSVKSPTKGYTVGP